MVKPGPKTEQPLDSKSRQDPLLEEHSILPRKTTTRFETAEKTGQESNYDKPLTKEGNHTYDKPLTTTNS
jgi:hypothetical protein